MCDYCKWFLCSVCDYAINYVANSIKCCENGNLKQLALNLFDLVDGSEVSSDRKNKMKTE